MRAFAVAAGVVLSAMTWLAACARTAPARPQVWTTSRATEESIAFPFPRSNDTAWAEIYVPARVDVVRAAVVFIERDGFDRYAFDDRDWRAMCARAACALVRVGFPTRDDAPPQRQQKRNAALGGDSVVFTALRLGGERTAHPELQRVNVVIFGLSAAGNFGPTFAALHPGRTIGIIRYHSHLRGLVVDTSTLASVPALTIVGARDDATIAQDSRNLWSALRARNAPWAYVSHFAQPHVSIDGLVEAGLTMREWTEALILRRTHAPPPLSPLAGSGWFVDDSTGQVWEGRGLDGQRSSASWAPNARTAFALRQLKGMCAPLSLTEATDLLGSGTKLEDEDTRVCHFVRENPHRDLWLSGFPHASDSAAIAWLHQAQRAIPLAALGDAANLMTQSNSHCGTVGAVRSSWTFYVSACGDGFGVTPDSARLRPLMARLLGLRSDGLTR